MYVPKLHKSPSFAEQSAMPAMERYVQKVERMGLGTADDLPRPSAMLVERRLLLPPGSMFLGTPVAKYISQYTKISSLHTMLIVPREGNKVLQSFGEDWQAGVEQFESQVRAFPAELHGFIGGSVMADVSNVTKKRWAVGLGFDPKVKQAIRNERQTLLAPYGSVYDRLPRITVTTVEGDNLQAMPVAAVIDELLPPPAERAMSLSRAKLDLLPNWKRMPDAA